MAYPYNDLGNLLHQLKRHEEAEAAYRKAIALDPDYATAYNNLGILLRRLKRYEEAEAAHCKAIELDPNYTWGYGNLGWLYYHWGRLEEATEFTEKALELKPNEFALIGNLALFHLLKGRIQQALALYERVQAPDVDSSRIEDAITDLREALGKNPDLAAAHYALGLLCEAEGEGEKAKEEYQKYLAESADGELRQSCTERLRRLG